MHTGNLHEPVEAGGRDADLPFQLGDWLVDPQNNQLRRNDSLTKLEPKVMDVLIYLARHPGQVVSREELEKHVWPGRIVTYDAITATIVKLRKAFQDHDETAPLIKTVSKRGYCLVAPIHPVPDGTNGSAQPNVQTVTPTPNNTTQTSSSADNGEIPRLQGIRAALTFRILLLAVTVLLILGIGIIRKVQVPAPDKSHRNHPLAATATQPVYTDVGGTADLEARNSLNTGWQHFTKTTPTDYRSAIALIRRATLLDPDYGLAYAALAAIYWNTWKHSWHILVGTSPLPHTLELTDEALQKAMRHPTPLAYRVSSDMLVMNRRYDQAIAEARKAIALAPNDPLGHLALANALVFSGQPEQARRSIDKAMQLNPHQRPAYLFTLGLIHFTSGHDDQAASLLNQALRISPQDHRIYVPLIAAYGLLGQHDKIVPLIREANRLRKACQLPLLNVSLPIDPYPYNPWPFQRREDVSHLQQGLRAAGLPEY